MKTRTNYSEEQIQTILSEKIMEEYNDIHETETDREIIYNTTPKKDKINVISLFSGCGGLDLGLELSGIFPDRHIYFDDELFYDKKKYDSLRNNSIYNVIYSNDIFEEANLSYKRNFNWDTFKDNRDIRKIKYFPKCDLVIGGFPCPGFSEAGPRLIDDERNFLYIHFIRCLTQSKPAVFVAENVKGMLTLGKGEVIKQISQDFASAGYNVDFKLLNARDFGVPQLRERVFIVGVRKDLNYKYKYPSPTHGNHKKNLSYVTLKDSIFDLRDNPGEYFTGSYSSIYMSRNRKKSWDEQSFTIQASGRQAPLHPDGDPMRKIDKDKWSFGENESHYRRLSVSEIKRIQTLPDWFYISKGNNLKLQENSLLNKQYTQIGNAVPILLAKSVFDPLTLFFQSKSFIKEEMQQLTLF